MTSPGSRVAVGQRRRIFARKPQRRPAWRGVFLVCLLAVAGIGVAGCVQLAATIAGPAAASTTQPTGEPSAIADRNVAVVDGETLRLAGHVVRLNGVSAPRRGEACRLAEDCAGRAALELAALVRDQPVTCIITGSDGDGHMLANCAAGDTDLGRALVRSGWASGARDNVALASAEQAAQQARLGLWAE